MIPNGTIAGAIPARSFRDAKTHDELHPPHLGFGGVLTLAQWLFLPLTIAALLMTHSIEPLPDMLVVIFLSAVATLCWRLAPGASATQVIVSLAAAGNGLAFLHALLGPHWTDAAPVMLIVTLTVCAGWRARAPLVAVAALIFAGVLARS